MNNSTENVTLIAVFVSDVLSFYPQADYPELYALVAGHDLSQSMNLVPMQVYNDVCAYVENNIGKVSIKRVGRKIGESAYAAMQQQGLLGEKNSPLQIMEALATVAKAVIQDPQGRGWDILDAGASSLVMRRTQTFNSTLQFGLLETLLYKSGAASPKVSYRTSVENGDEFDEYLLTWISLD